MWNARDATVTTMAKVTLSCVAAAAVVAACTSSGGRQQPAHSSRYEDLVALFADWRAFQQPRMVNGVPDYTAAAMAVQQRELPAYQRRLAAKIGRASCRERV